MIHAHTSSMTRHLIVLLATLLGAVALAQGAAPQVDHSPLTRIAHGEATPIRARIVSMSTQAVYEPAVYVRLGGITSFIRLPMRAEGGLKDVYVAEISPTMATEDFEYYVEAYDEAGNGPGRVGSPEKPFHVLVGAPIATHAVPPPPPPVAGQPGASQATAASAAAGPEGRTSAGPTAGVSSAAPTPARRPGFLLGAGGRIYYRHESSGRDSWGPGLEVVIGYDFGAIRLAGMLTYLPGDSHGFGVGLRFGGGPRAGPLRIEFGADGEAIYAAGAARGSVLALTAHLFGLSFRPSRVLIHARVLSVGIAFAPPNTFQATIGGGLMVAWD